MTMGDKGNYLDDGYLDRIVDEFSDTVYKLAFARLRNKSDADDVFQEVFLRFVRKKPEFKSDEHAKAWFIRVTLNCCNSFWNTAFRRHTQPLEENMEMPSEEVHWLTPLLLQLPENYRSVLHLYYYEDLSVKQISEILNKKESTVRVQLMRARDMLRTKSERGGFYAE